MGGCFGKQQDGVPWSPHPQCSIWGYGFPAITAQSVAAPLAGGGTASLSSLTPPHHHPPPMKPLGHLWGTRERGQRVLLSCNLPCEGERTTVQVP